MSTQVNTYVLYGVVLPYIEVADDKLEPYLDSAFDAVVNPKGNVTILADGMCGEYMAVGHVLAKSRNGEGFDQPASFGPTPDMALVDAVTEALADIGAEASEQPFRWHVISHYR